MDLNRNYDFLWDFRSHFSPSAAVASSARSSDSTYTGPGAASEPETANVNWLCRQYDPVVFVDVHSYSEYVLYNWADDNSQTTDPDMNFQNPVHDGARGVKADTAYREFIRREDSARNRRLAEGMRDAIEQVRGHRYTAMEWVDMYAASGTSTDFQQSLSYLRRSRRRSCAAFCLECGKQFQPPLDERASVIREVTAGMLQLLQDA